MQIEIGRNHGQALDGHSGVLVLHSTLFVLFIPFVDMIPSRAKVLGHGVANEGSSSLYTLEA